MEQTELETIRTSLNLPPSLSRGGPPGDGDLSVRKLDIWDACQLRYQNHYILKLDKGPQGGSTDAMRDGALVHRILEELARSRVGQTNQGEPVSVKELRQLFKTKAGENARVGSYGRAWELLRPLAGAGKLVFARTVAVEEPLRLDFDQGYTLVGQLDRLDAFGDSLVVWDYKSGDDVRSQEELEEDYQVRAYLAAIHALTGATSLRFSTWFLGADEATDVFWTPEGDDWLLATLRDRRRRIHEATTFAANPGRACFDCPWASTCPARASALTDELTTRAVAPFADDDETILAERQRLKAREELAAHERKRYDEHLRARLAGGRKVIGRGVAAGLRSRRTDTRLPPASVVFATFNASQNQLVRDLAAKIPPLCAPERRDLERLIRELPDTESEKIARDLLSQISVPVEGASYVEVRKT